MGLKRGRGASRRVGAGARERRVIRGAVRERTASRGRRRVCRRVIAGLGVRAGLEAGKAGKNSDAYVGELSISSRCRAPELAVGYKGFAQWLILDCRWAR